jgi:molybdopterin/thiamine biosynthesis adenylyltransferase
VHLYDPEITRLNDLGANFYTEEQHVGKVSRAEACLTKLRELNPYVKVEIISDEAALKAGIANGNLHVVCQTEMLLNGKVIDHQELDGLCREKKVGYIST